MSSLLLKESFCSSLLNNVFFCNEVFSIDAVFNGVDVVLLLLFRDLSENKTSAPFCLTFSYAAIIFSISFKLPCLVKELYMPCLNESICLVYLLMRVLSSLKCSFDNSFEVEMKQYTGVGKCVCVVDDE